MGDLHFLNWVRLVVFVFFQHDAGPHEGNEERREAPGCLTLGDFSMATSADREVFFIGANRQVCPTRLA